MENLKPLIKTQEDILTKRKKRKEIYTKFFWKEYIKEMKDVKDWFQVIFDKTKITWISYWEDTDWMCLISKDTILDGKKSDLFDISGYLDKGSDDTITIKDKSIVKARTKDWKEIKI